MSLRGECVDGRWREEIMQALPDGEVVFSRGSTGYQGQVALVARLDDGRWLHIDWSYGSCSGCDSWDEDWGWHGEEGVEARREKVREEWRRMALVQDADTFADWLVGCWAAKAEWLTGMASWSDNTTESYFYYEHTGLAPDALALAVRGGR